MVYPSLNHFVFGSAIIVMAEAPVPSLSDNESQGSFDGMAVLDVVGCQLDDSSVIPPVDVPGVDQLDVSHDDAAAPVPQIQSYGSTV